MMENDDLAAGTGTEARLPGALDQMALFMSRSINPISWGLHVRRDLSAFVQIDQPLAADDQPNMAVQINSW
jgi:hypothetical protein